MNYGPRSKYGKSETQVDRTMGDKNYAQNGLWASQIKNNDWFMYLSIFCYELLHSDLLNQKENFSVEEF